MSDTVRFRNLRANVVKLLTPDEADRKPVVQRVRKVKLGSLRQYIRSIEIFKEGTTR